MKLKTYVVALLCTAQLPAQAQNTDIIKPVKANPYLSFRYAVKVSNITTITQNEVWYTDSMYRRSGSYTRYAHAAPALQIMTKRKNIHEIELTEFSISRKEDFRERIYPDLIISTSGESSKITSIALRYEYILNFSKKRDSRFIPSLGFAASPYYLRFRVDPLVTAFYPTRDNFIGLRTFIIPRLTYHISKRLFIDVNVPACITDMYYHHSTNMNPLNPADKQASNSFNFDAIPFHFSFRGGIGLKL